MCVTKFGATELRNENSDVNIRRFCTQTRARILSYHSDDSFDKKIIHSADITLLYMCVINEK